MKSLNEKSTGKRSVLLNIKIYLLKIDTSNSAHIDKLNPSPKPFNINFLPPFIFIHGFENDVKEFVFICVLGEIL